MSDTLRTRAQAVRVEHPSLGVGVCASGDPEVGRKFLSVTWNEEAQAVRVEHPSLGVGVCVACPGGDQACEHCGKPERATAWLEWDASQEVFWDGEQAQAGMRSPRTCTQCGQEFGYVMEYRTSGACCDCKIDGLTLLSPRRRDAKQPDPKLPGEDDARYEPMTPLPCHLRGWRMMR